MLVQGEKSVSAVKKKGGGLRVQFQRMHLAIYPYEIQFYQNVVHHTAFYFQKNYQVIGSLQQAVGKNKKNTKVPFTDINNLIPFRISSSDNVVYKWSAYRRQEGKEEEYLDSCTINLREVVNSFLTPQQVRRRTPPSSQIQLGFIEKELRLKFSKVGVILIFYLFVAGNPMQIQQYVQRKLINKEEDPIIQNTFLRTDSSVNNIGLTSMRAKTPNTSAISGVMKKSSDPLVEQSNSKFSKNNSASNLRPSVEPVIKINKHDHNSTTNQLSLDPKKQETLLKPSTSQNLENLIFNFDSKGGAGDTEKEANLNLDSQSLQFREKEDPDMVFREELKTESIQVKPVELKISESMDYGYLKLESDQGRVKQDPIDNKLEQLELQAIQEDEPSREVTINVSGLDNHFHKNKLKYKPKRTGSIREQLVRDEQFQAKPPNMKKVIFLFMFALMLLLVTVIVSRQRGREKRRIKR